MQKSRQKPVASVNLISWVDTPLGTGGRLNGQLVAKIRRLGAGGFSAAWLDGRKWNVEDQLEHTALQSSRHFKSLIAAKKAMQEVADGGSPKHAGRSVVLAPMKLREALHILMQAASNDARGSGLGYRSTSEQWRVNLARAWTVAHSHVYKREPDESDYRNSGMMPPESWVSALDIHEMEQGLKDLGA